MPTPFIWKRLDRLSVLIPRGWILHRVRFDEQAHDLSFGDFRNRGVQGIEHQGAFFASRDIPEMTSY